MERQSWQEQPRSRATAGVNTCELLDVSCRSCKRRHCVPGVIHQLLGLQLPKDILSYYSSLYHLTLVMTYILVVLSFRFVIFKSVHYKH